MAMPKGPEVKPSILGLLGRFGYLNRMPSSSPITTFQQGAAQALLQAREVSQEWTFGSAQQTRAMLRSVQRSAKRR